MTPAATTLFPTLKRLIGLAATLGLCLAAAGPAAASVATINWLLPAGGETWTAGTTHTVEWAGGPPSATVNVQLIRVTPFQTALPIALGVSNSGDASFTIPSNMAPGAYLVYIEDVPLTEWTYSQAFTIQPGPNCAAGGVLTSVSFPVNSPPLGVCGQTAAAALAAAQVYTQNLLSSACPNGYTQDPSSAMFDLTILPVGICLSGYSGAYVAEGSAVVCCYPNPVPVEHSNWSRIKALYR